MDFRREFVENAGDVGARIMILRGLAAFVSASCAEVSVADGGKGFAEFFLFRVEFAVMEVPAVFNNAFGKPAMNVVNRDLAKVAHDDICPFLFQVDPVYFTGNSQYETEIAFGSGLNA